MGFGRNLKAAREAKGLTQEQLARLLDVTVYTVSKWEREEHEPPAETMRRAGKLLGTSGAQLIE
jgi:transcriptional regulator with XRE-family HTH domain